MYSNVHAQKSVYKIAFGSCGHQDHPLPIFDVIVQHQPNLFVFLGDNIYGDTDNMDTLKAQYAKLAAKPTYQRLKKKVPIIATWDDHDFGSNDAGRNYPFKKASKEIFLNFFNEPLHSERRQHEGIYTSYYYNCGGKRIQIILLDNRTFRADLKKYNGEFAKDERYFYTLDYAPHTTSDSVFLGEAQWKWLEGEFKKPADLRLIGSGSQFGIEYNGYEAWANYPFEQQRMLNLIKSTQANGVMFLSGDVHYAEISKLSPPNLYPIYDVTASGLSSTWLFAAPNKNRIEGPVMENHFGLLTFDCTKTDPSVKMEIWDDTNNQRIEYTVPLSQLAFHK
ncbi:MAG: alkaline phosphatase D family protein [Ferruginibacter sp.]